MTEHRPSSIGQSSAFALVCVGLMIVGFGIASFSTILVFKLGTGFTPLVSLAVPAAFLIYAFYDKFPQVGRDWNALKAFTVGAYALCIAPVIIFFMLRFILALFNN